MNASRHVLVLGGGGFLGHHVVAAALAHGHEVTVLSRSASPRADVETLHGDRTGDLSALQARTWDAVVDTYTDDTPGATDVRRTAALLAGSVGTYCYVSGMSVYAPDGPAVPTERAPVRRAGHEPDDDPLQARSLAKLAGERAVSDAFDGPALFPRVGIMVGPRDPSQRFTYWPVRFHDAITARAPVPVTGPGSPTRAVQYSDARDIADWIVRMVGAGRGGTFNTVGPLRDESLADVLAACLTAAREVAGDALTAAPIEWQDETVLADLLSGVPDEERPLWYPEPQIPQEAIDSRAAFASGLRFRPARDTALDTLRWTLRENLRPLETFHEPAR